MDAFEIIDIYPSREEYNELKSKLNEAQILPNAGDYLYPQEGDTHKVISRHFITAKISKKAIFDVILILERR